MALPTKLVQTAPRLPTGTARISHDLHGEPLFVIERPAAFDAVELTRQALASIQTLRPDWIYMGTLLQSDSAMENLVGSLLEGVQGARCFYDMNLRTGHWSLPLVERLCRSASILKLNEVEAKTLAVITDAFPRAFSLESFCEAWAHRFDIEIICVTLGPGGCLIFSKEGAQRFPGYAVQVSDTVGAGDAFAAAFLHGFHQGWTIRRCAGFANALGALVASRPGATPDWTKDDMPLIEGS
jgi:fructokinase